jgi:alpha-amylase/alpha-mannosidase (GH57 family)
MPQLMAKGDGFTPADRQALLAELGAAVGDLVPRYRALADSGQVELSCTPGTHPLAPLLIDFNAAREAWPDAPARRPEYRRPLAGRSAPGGGPRLPRAHFGQAPVGLWPAEGALSTPFLKQIGEAGFSGRQAATAYSSIQPATTHAPMSPGCRRKARRAT